MLSSVPAYFNSGRGREIEMKDEGGMLFALLPKHKFSSFRQQMGKKRGLWRESSSDEDENMDMFLVRY